MCTNLSLKKNMSHATVGVWNGIWTDQFIESTFMKVGHGTGGIIGITFKPEAVKTWA